MKIFLIFLLTSLILSGCSSDSRDLQMAGDSQPTTDPVSRAEVRTDSPWKTQWNGEWYFFESEENLKKFRAKPTSYVTSEGTPKRERRTIYPHDLK
jgi:YHS domain-containing protein